MDRDMELLDAELKRINFQLPPWLVDHISGLSDSPFSSHTGAYGFGRWYSSFGEAVFGEMGYTATAGVLTELSNLLASKDAISLMLATAGLGHCPINRWYAAFDIHPDDSDMLAKEIVKALLGFAVRRIRRLHPKWDIGMPRFTEEGAEGRAVI